MNPKAEGPLCSGILWASRRASIKQSNNLVPNLSCKNHMWIRTLPLKAAKSLAMRW